MATDIKLKIGLEGVPQVQAGANAAAAALGKIGQSADGTVAAFGSLNTAAGALRSLGGIAVVGALAGEFVKAADSVTVLQNQLKLATGSTAAAGSAYEALFSIAQRSRVSFTELGGTFASISRATDGLGISQARLLTVTEAIGNAMAISGGNAAGMQAALTQLGQGLASGTLRGEELNSVLEQTPRLARAIADGMGVTVGQLRALGQEGKITAESLIGALESQAAVLTGEVQGAVLTVSQGWQVLANSATRAVGELNQASGTTSTLAAAMQALSVRIDDTADLFTRAREAGRGFMGTLATVQLMAIAETMGHIDVGAANIGRRLAEAEKEAARLQQRFAERGGIYLAMEAAQAEELAKKLREAKQAQDDLKLERSTSQSQQFGQVSSGIDAIAAKGLAGQREAQEALATIRNKALGVDKAYTDTITKLHTQLQAGYLTYGEYTEAVQKHTATTFKAADGSKKLGDDLKRQVAAGKALTEQMELQAAGLSGGFLEDWAKLGAAYTAGAISVGQLETAQARLLAQQPAMQASAKAAADAAEAIAAARRREADTVDAHIASERDRAQQVAATAEQALQQAQFELQTQGMLRSEIAAVTLQRLQDQQAGLSAGTALYEAKQREIDAQRELVRVLRQGEVRDASIAAARAAADEWQRTSDQIGQALADALMQGGRSAGDYLKGYFRNLVLQPLIRAVIDPVSGAIAAFVSGGAGGGGGANATAAGINNASTLMSLYQAATGYSGGVNALAAYLGAGQTAGASGLSLAYANTVGAAGGDALGSFIAGNGSWAGVGASQASLAASESATLFASQAAGEGITVASGTGAAAGSGGSSAMGSFGAYAAYAAMIYAAAQYASKLYGQGFTGSQQLDGKWWYDYGPDKNVTGHLIENLGLSEKWTEILSGNVRLNHMFGRAQPRVTDSGFSGSIGAGDFSGQLFADVLEKGGLFRSDKRYTQTGALPDDLGRFLDDASATVFAKAKEFGEALGLPAQELAGVTSQVRVVLTDDAEKNKAEIAKALGIYGDALIAGWADEVAPLRQYGETTAQVIARVGGSIVQVNQILDSLGVAALQASVAGGQAAIELDKLFGGQLGAVAGNYQAKFYTEAERAGLAADAVGKALGTVNLKLPDTRDGFRDLVEAQDLSTEAGRRAFTVLLANADAFDFVAQSAEQARGRLEDAIGQALPKFQTPAEREQSTYARLAGQLQGAGVNVTAQQLQGASLDDVEAFATSFVQLGTNSTEAKTTIVQVAGALADLKLTAADAAKAVADQQAELDIELLRATGNETAATARERQNELAALRELNPALAQTKQFIYDAIDAATAASRVQDVIRGADAVAGDFLSGAELTGYLSGRISEILAKGGIDAPASAIATSTKEQVLELFRAVGIGGKEVILEALPLWQQMRDAIDAAGDAQRQFTDDLLRFTGSLKFSDLSPLSQADQLAAAQGLYDSTLAKARAGDEGARGQLTNVAQALLQEAQGAYASGMAYTRIFDQVVGDLDMLALGGTGAALATQTQGGAPQDRSLVEGPAGSSGGLSGGRDPGRVIDLGPAPASFEAAFASPAADRQIAKLEAKFDLLLAAMQKVAAAADANAVIDQAGFQGLIAEVAAIRAPLSGIEREARLGGRERALG